ncbi:hypothetical protein [Faecalibacter bovis]|uniref:Uncharacterized protein n=1 Tax=Faecalibacter bovis TaxID=2898187 RepID=A0ABX7XEF5_9FLAO|nr:hypothetical protein [Faecalibacter bovis]QTV06248.1 hypothetical protein J9309_02635 [Faecalibacter bovis]
MMNKAFECAVILTEKHKILEQQIVATHSYSSQKELRKKQTVITSQMLDFLAEIQEFKSIILLNNNLKDIYNNLIKYYSKQISLKINRYQMQIDLLKFESNITLFDQESKNYTHQIQEIEIIQGKLNTYYQLIKM